jgi:hypothetical protein
MFVMQAYSRRCLFYFCYVNDEIMPFQKVKHIYGEEVKITHKCLLWKLIVQDVCFPKGQQFVYPCFLLLLSMVGFGENLKVCKSGCCANE